MLLPLKVTSGESKMILGSLNAYPVGYGNVEYVGVIGTDTTV